MINCKIFIRSANFHFFTRKIRSRLPPKRIRDFSRRSVTRIITWLAKVHLFFVKHTHATRSCKHEHQGHSSCPLFCLCSVLLSHPGRSRSYRMWNLRISCRWGTEVPCDKQDGERYPSKRVFFFFFIFLYSNFFDNTEIVTALENDCSILGKLADQVC